MIPDTNAPRAELERLHHAMLHPGRPCPEWCPAARLAAEQVARRAS